MLLTHNIVSTDPSQRERTFLGSQPFPFLGNFYSRDMSLLQQNKYNMLGKSNLSRDSATC